MSLWVVLSVLALCAPCTYAKDAVLDIVAEGGTASIQFSNLNDVAQPPFALSLAGDPGAPLTLTGPDESTRATIPRNVSEPMTVHGDLNVTGDVAWEGGSIPAELAALRLAVARLTAPGFPRFPGFATSRRPSGVQGPLAVASTWTAGVGHSVETAPALHDGVLYIGSNNGRLVALDAKTGDHQWKFDTDGAVKSSPAVSDASGSAVVFFGNEDKMVYAVNRTGHPVWVFDAGAAVKSSPAITADGHIVIIGCDSGEVFGLDALTGSKRWSIRTSGAVVGGVSIGVDGTAYFGSYDNFLYAVDSQTGLLREWALRVFLTVPTARRSVPFS